MPFNSEAAVALLDSFRPYLEWQSTTSYIKEPPAEYAEKVQAPYDFYAEFESIYETAKSNGYANEYEFGFDLYRCFQQTHDGHFVFIPDSVGWIFTFSRTTPLVSVSLDGQSIPQVYVYADVLAASLGNTSFTPSPITEIDGQDSTEFLLNWSQYGSLQDRDALWNNMFYLLGQVSLGGSGSGTGTFSGGGRGRWIYPGANTTLTFANGTSVTNQNFARVLQDFTGIQSGADIYRTFFTPPADVPWMVGELVSSLEAASTTATPTSTSASTPTSTGIPAPGYPSPIVREMNNLNGGYYLSGEGYEDVAVLNVASFVGSIADEIPFQSVNTYFLQRARADGKKKLIIDLSANGGGTILQGYDLFKQLFPSILPYGATRFRAHEAFDLIGQETSEFCSRVPRSLAANDTVLNVCSAALNYHSDADADYEPFASWPAKYGPHEHGPGPDSFTSLIRWNLSDVFTPLNSGGIYISGYLERANVTEQPFAAEDIVLVTDGYCASTCAIFAELMTDQGGVRTVNLGGRPNTAATQAVGGVKGTNNFPWTYILELASYPFAFNYLHSDDYYANDTVLGAYGDLPFWRAASTPNVNSRDGIRRGDEEQVPLHFVYQEADCRLFYTPAMAVDQTAAWKTVADVAFNGLDGCVAGGGYGKRGVSSARVHRARSDLDVRQLADAIDSVWTNRGGITMDGDSIMFL